MCSEYRIGMTFEERVDYDIKNGILPENERQQTIDQLYKIYNEIMNDLYNTSDVLYH